MKIITLVREVPHKASFSAVKRQPPHDAGDDQNADDADGGCLCRIENAAINAADNEPKDQQHRQQPHQRAQLNVERE